MLQGLDTSVINSVSSTIQRQIHQRDEQMLYLEAAKFHWPTETIVTTVVLLYTIGIWSHPVSFHNQTWPWTIVKFKMDDE